MLADTESEKTKWVVALSELHRILKRNNLPNTTVSDKMVSRYNENLIPCTIFIPLLFFFCFSKIFRVKELLDNTLALIKNVMSGTIIDPDRLVIGTEEGLFCLDLDRSGE